MKACPGARNTSEKQKFENLNCVLGPGAGSRFQAIEHGPIIATHSRTSQGARYPRYVRAHYSISPPLVHSEEASRSCTYRHSTFSTINRTVQERRFDSPGDHPRQPGTFGCFSPTHLSTHHRGVLPTGRRPRGRRREIARPQRARRMPHRHPEGSSTLNDEHAMRRHVPAACRAQRFWC